jgi:hypothetical protein
MPTYAQRERNLVGSKNYEKGLVWKREQKVGKTSYWGGGGHKNRKKMKIKCVHVANK